jgi:hypothetical protein
MSYPIIIMKRLLLWLLAPLVIVLIACAAGFHFWFLAFLQSEQCRQWLNRALSGALHAKGELMPLQSTQGSLYSDGFIARDGAAFRLLQADQLRAETHFGFWARTCSVEHLDITRVRVDLGDGQREAGASALTGSTPIFSGNGGGPWRDSHFILRQLAIEDLELEWGSGELKGTRLTAWPTPPAEWLFSGQGGSLKFPDGSEAGQLWRVESFDARVHGETIFLTGAQLRIGEQGQVHLEGELPRNTGEPAHCHAAFSKIPVGPWLPDDWRVRLTGGLSGQVDLQIGTGRPGGGVRTLEGDVALSEGELTALPVLDQIATVTHADGFRRAKITKASARVAYSAGSWQANQVVVESSGLFKIEGQFTVKSGRIDGAFQLGMPPSALQSVPGARERVFTVFRDGYLWTPVRLSGPMRHPSEDLSGRLASAVIAQTAGDVQQSVRDNAKGVLDLVRPLLPLTLPSLPELPKLLP